MEPVSKNILLFLGIPGSGKGTLAQRCCATLNYEQVSTGNLCREHVAQQTDIGKKIDLALKSGKLIDDSLITDMVLQWFSQHSEKQHVILDGYPRTVIQAEALDRFVKQSNITQPTVIYLQVDEPTVIQRLGMRLICSKTGCQAVYSLASSENGDIPSICAKCSSVLVRRPDDETAAIKKRLALYQAHEQALLECYRRLAYEISALDASRAAEDVFAALRTKLGVRS